MTFTRAATPHVGSNRPQIHALGGAAWAVSPNSEAAFAGALLEGADGLALVIEVTRDGIAVACDDATARACRLCGEEVSDLRFEDLASVDPFGSGAASESTGIMALRQVVERFPDTPVTAILGESTRPHLEKRGLLSLLRGADAAVVSDRLSLLVRCRMLAPELPRYLRIADPAGAPTFAWEDLVSGFCVSVRAPSDVLREMASRGRIIGFGCDSTGAVASAAAGPFDTLLTQRPAWLLRQLSRRV